MERQNRWLQCVRLRRVLDSGPAYESHKQLVSKAGRLRETALSLGPTTITPGPESDVVVANLTLVGRISGTIAGCGAWRMRRTWCLMGPNNFLDLADERTVRGQ